MKLATAVFTAALALAPVVGLAEDRDTVLPPNNPTTLLDLALGLTPLSMRQIGAVIAPLSPGK